MYLEEKLNGIKFVLSDRKYLAFFAVLALFFYFLYPKAWNMVAPLKILRYSPTPEAFYNLLFLIALSALSSLAVVLSLFSLKGMPLAKGRASRYGFFSIIPAFFISASSCCAPFVFTLLSTTIGIGTGIGIGMAKFGYAVKTLSFALILLTTLSLSSNISKCCIGKGGGKNEGV